MIAEGENPYRIALCIHCGKRMKWDSEAKMEWSCNQCCIFVGRNYGRLTYAKPAILRHRELA